MNSKRNEEQDLVGRQIGIDQTNKPLPRTIKESLDTFSQNRGFLHPERNFNADTFSWEQADYHKRCKIEPPESSKGTASSKNGLASATTYLWLSGWYLWHWWFQIVLLSLCQTSTWKKMRVLPLPWYGHLKINSLTESRNESTCPLSHGRRMPENQTTSRAPSWGRLRSEFMCIL